MKDKTISVRIETILKTAELHPDKKTFLKSLFPDAFEGEKDFCRIGDVLLRKGKNSIYAVIKRNNEVGLINIEHSAEWKSTIKYNTLKNCHKVGDNIMLTYSEFEIIAAGYAKDFIVLPKQEIINQYDK